MHTQNPRLKFFKNHNDIVVGDLYTGDQQLLATSHPATIAAALYSMQATRLTVETDEGSCEVNFPLMNDDLVALGHVVLKDHATFMNAFATFSWFDFLNPMPGDDQAEIHLRTAVHHLPPEYVQRQPETPASKGWKKALRFRNKFGFSLFVEGCGGVTPAASP